MSSGVFGISDDAFIRRSRLVYVYIGSGVGYICHNAFAHCESLRQVVIDESVMSDSVRSVHTIMSGAFRDCTSLKNS